MVISVLAALIAAQPAAAAPPPPASRPLVARGAVQTRAEVGAQVQTLFARLDVNRDGFVTRDEARGGRAALRPDRADRRNRRADVRGPERGSQGRMATFDRLDTDRNGVLSRDEFARGSEFRADRRSARLEGKGELRGGRGAMNLAGRMFDLADANRDGRVSIQEATAAAYQRFDTADLNRDGQLTREERRQSRQRLRAPRG